jgi:hypothetical protein
MPQNPQRRHGQRSILLTVVGPSAGSGQTAGISQIFQSSRNSSCLEVIRSGGGGERPSENVWTKIHSGFRLNKYKKDNQEETEVKNTSRSDFAP